MEILLHLGLWGGNLNNELESRQELLHVGLWGGTMNWSRDKNSSEEQAVNG